MPLDDHIVTHFTQHLDCFDPQAVGSGYSDRDRALWATVGLSPARWYHGKRKDPLPGEWSACRNCTGGLGTNRREYPFGRPCEVCYRLGLVPEDDVATFVRATFCAGTLVLPQDHDADGEWQHGIDCPGCADCCRARVEHVIDQVEKGMRTVACLAVEPPTEYWSEDARKAFLKAHWYVREPLLKEVPESRGRITHPNQVGRS